MTKPTEVKPTEMDDSIEVKQEFDIKLEEDEVDTIEYTPLSNQMAEIFVPKVEKTEPEDSDDDDNPWELFDRFGYLDSFKTKPNTMPKSTEAKTRDTANSSQSHASEDNIAAIQRSGEEVNNVDEARTVSVTGLHVDTGTKKAHAKAKNKKTAFKVQSNSMKKMKRQLRCTACDYVTSRPSHLIRHMLKHTGEKPLPCKHCPKRFTNKQSLQSHMKVHIKKDSLNCSICWEVFATNTELVDHQSACKQRRYECHLCKKFSTFYFSDLRVHMRVHNGLRPFRCDLCSNKFTKKSSLKKHIKTHTNPRPLPVKFQCSVCAQNFLDRFGRDAHELNCKRRRYECHLCQSYMSHRKPQLKYHMRVQHTGERPFKCKLCTKTYLERSNLNRHMKSHKQYEQSQ